MEDIFDVENFNLISDEDNYYFFRSLEPGDIEDIQNNIIIDGNNYIKLRTDRERWEENHKGEKSRWNSESIISLEEIYSHIKIHYSLQTNCISFSSNANIARMYGESFSDRFVMIKVPKKEMGDRVFHAGQYMLREIEKRVNVAISNDIPDSIMEDIQKIENSKTSDEIRDIIKTKYKTKQPIDTSKSGLKKGIKYRSPHTRISNFQALNEDQILKKNKIIAKLTILERKKILPPIIPYTINNNSLIQTLGSAFSSSEQIYYGDVEGERITEISKEVLDLFGLLQQYEEEDISDLKNELIKFVKDKKQLEIPQTSLLKKDFHVRDNITIEEMYELTGGRVEFGQAQAIIKNMFYLAKSQASARELVDILRQITKNNPIYEDVIKYIENNGFVIEPKISTRKSNKGYRISESVNFNLKEYEIGLVEEIRKLSTEEQLEIIQNGGISNVRNIMNRTFAKIQSEDKISKERYYAMAIADAYNWKEMGIDEFSIEQRNELIQKLEDKKSALIYIKLKEAGINEADIPKYVINIASKENLNKLIDSDSFIEELHKNIGEISQDISIEQIESFLGYYNIEGTDIQLRDYQRQAVQKTDEIFEDKKFASVILPTGAGKSFVAITELLERKDEQMLYLAPQHEILEQIKEYIIQYVHGKKGTLGKTKDEIIAEVFPNLEFKTYQNLLTANGVENIEKQYGFIVLDELHRTGAQKWEKKLDKLIENQTEQTRVLGITATPTRDVDDRNMTNEIALKLGYTQEEINTNMHIAINIDLINAIRLGLVVNPKLVTCEYTLKTNGTMENLLEKINSMENENERKEKLEQYEKLRRKLDEAEGIQEILQSNIKPGGKYIVFIPVTESQKNIEDKVKAYEQIIREYLRNLGIMLEFNSMLGKYGDKKNEKQLQEFEINNPNTTKFMIVINKANEGIHIRGLDGLIWFRALDENSTILYCQQLGRVINSEDPDNPTKEEDRPIVIDIANNSLNVHIEKVINENTSKSDLELLTIAVEWMKHYDMIPNINSSNLQERKYAATLYRIQQKYLKYLKINKDDHNFTDEIDQEIKSILIKGQEVDLWDINFPPKSRKEIEKIINVEQFEVKGILRDFVNLENMVDKELAKTRVESFIEIAEKLNSLGVDCSKMTERDTIESLCKKFKISKEKIIEIGLDPNLNIGTIKTRISQVYRGTANGIPPTEKQVKKLKELGIPLDKNISAVQKFINIIEELNELGVDCSKITTKDTVGSLCQKFKISKEKVIEIGLDPNCKIGNMKGDITKAYRGIGKHIPPTEEQAKRLKELGIPLDKKISAVQKFINIIKELNELGIDCSKINQNDTIESLCQKFEISKEKIIEIGLNPNCKIGYMRNDIAKAYRGIGDCIPPTEDQVKRLKELGISLEHKRKARTSKEVAKASISAIKNVELADKEDIALKKLVDKEKSKEDI